MKRNKTREERRLATKIRMTYIGAICLWLFILLLLLGSIRPKGSAASGANTDSARGTNHRQHITLEENVNENR